MTSVRERVAQSRQRKREAGLIPKERWAHPNDWPKIDAYMAQLANGRK